MKAIYNILNNRDKVTMKHFYHIIYDPDLDEGFCSMQRIPCAYTGCVEQLTNPWLPNLDKNLQPRYAIKPKHVITLPYYVDIINGIFPILTLFKETTNQEKM